MSVGPGSLLAGRYRIQSGIAVGGMGEVWRAVDDVVGRPVAVKVLKPQYAADPTFLTRFRREARHTAGLAHPGIARVLDYGEAQAAEGGPVTAFLVMELLAGEPLSAVIGRQGRLPVDLVLSVVGQVGLALQAAHDAGVVHRDVKPGNLMLAPDGTVKITDFGIAWAAGTTPLTGTGMLVGTADYLAPELSTGGAAGPASDLYALGVVGYEGLAGRRPFVGANAVSIALAHMGDPPPPLPGDVPGPVAALVLRTLAKDPADRPASAGQLGREALALRQPHSNRAVQPSPDPAPGRASTAPPTLVDQVVRIELPPTALQTTDGGGGSPPGDPAGVRTRHRL